MDVEPVKVEISELKGNSSLKLIIMAAQQSAIDFEIKNCVKAMDQPDHVTKFL